MYNGVCDADQDICRISTWKPITIEGELYDYRNSTIVDAIKDDAFREFLIGTYGSNGGITQEEADRVTDLGLMPTMRRKWEVFGWYRIFSGI